MKFWSDYGLFDVINMEDLYQKTYPMLDIVICQIGETSCKFQWKVGMCTEIRDRFEDYTV